MTTSFLHLGADINLQYSSCFRKPPKRPNDPKSDLVKFLTILDYITTSIFSLEVAIKIIALGFYFNGELSYMKNEWNVVDFVIAVCSIISLTSDNIPSIKIIRMARLLRPLKVISKNRNLQASI